jgi:hypothetical protein
MTLQFVVQSLNQLHHLVPPVHVYKLVMLVITFRVLGSCAVILENWMLGQACASSTSQKTDFLKYLPCFAFAFICRGLIY